MKIFDDGSRLPEMCKEQDPDLPYCQIMGKYSYYFTGYNTIDLYDNMNNYCPSLAPEFFRPDGC